jgi:hypothetical protein
MGRQEFPTSNKGLSKSRRPDTGIRNDCNEIVEKGRRASGRIVEIRIIDPSLPIPRPRAYMPGILRANI